MVLCQHSLLPTLKEHLESIKMLVNISLRILGFSIFSRQNECSRMEPQSKSLYPLVFILVFVIGGVSSLETWGILTHFFPSS